MTDRRAGDSIRWTVSAGAVLGGIILILVQLGLAAACIIWLTDTIELGVRLGMSTVLYLVTAALSAAAGLLVLSGLVRKRLGPMRLGAVLALVPGIIAVTQQSSHWWLAPAVLAATVLGVVLTFTARRPKNLVFG